MSKDEIVRALIDEMRCKLMSATHETRADDDAAILLLSGVLATFTVEQAMPQVMN